MWPFKRYLFNVTIGKDFDCPVGSKLVSDLVGKTVSVREDGAISYRARRKLPTYEAELDMDPPAHLHFMGESVPSIEFDISPLEELFELLAFRDIQSPPRMRLLTAPIEREGNKYRLSLRTSREDVENPSNYMHPARDCD